MHRLVDELFIQTSEAAEKPHTNVAESFNKLRLSEIENKIEKTIDAKAANETTQVLEETIKSLQRLLETQKQNSSKVEL